MSKKKTQKRLKIEKLLEFSIKNKLGHIPSALSMFDYLDYLWNECENGPDKDWNIVIGKPYGSQAYYTIWEKDLKDLEINPDTLSYGVKNKEIPFVNYSEETLGNALGVGAGISLANNIKTWCNISDAVLQMGPTLEAIQFIGKEEIDILLTVDYNDYQLTSKISKEMKYKIYEVYSLFSDFGWNVMIVRDKNYKKIPGFLKKKGPKVILFETIKGDFVREMRENPIKWHYKILENIDDVKIEETK
jgi:transketolase N-terminal domain/subunit